MQILANEDDHEETNRTFDSGVRARSTSRRTSSAERIRLSVNVILWSGLTLLARSLARAEPEYSIYPLFSLGWLATCILRAAL